MSTPRTASSQRGSFAATVSRKLIAAGVHTLPSGTAHANQGIRVTSGMDADHCGIAIDIDLPRRAAHARESVIEVLTEAGYVVTPNPHDGLLLTISRKA